MSEGSNARDEGSVAAYQAGFARPTICKNCHWFIHYDENLHRWKHSAYGVLVCLDLDGKSVAEPS